MIRSFSVKDLPPELRREGAARVKNTIRQLLANPFLTPDQIQHLNDKMAEITKWENGEISTQPVLP